MIITEEQSSFFGGVGGGDTLILQVIKCFT